jgi:radical SAM superfamily enzyme YgiQ (UPF0313 family)
MKVLLVQPPVEDFYDTAIRTYPLALLYIATRVRAVADVAILDARTGRKPAVLKNPFPGLDTFYRPDIYTPFSFFGRYYRFGLTHDEIHREIAAQQPDVVGIASMCSAYERQAGDAAKAAKEVSREIITVVGGTHATVFPDRLLADENVDYCIRGEGETPFFELMQHLKAGRAPGGGHIPGLCYRDGTDMRIPAPHVENGLDITPARDLVAADRYRIGRKKYTFLLTSRGCPFSCGFCGKPAVPYRRRTIDRIEREVDDCTERGIEAFDFEDDMLNLDKSFFASVLDLFADRRCTLSAMNGIYPNTLDVPTLQRMYAAGFRRLNFSLVDVAPSVLGGQNRNAQGSFLALLPYLEQSPFLVEVHFIIGLPGQHPDRLLDTLLFLMEKRLLLGPSIFYMAPGSAIYERDGKWLEIPPEAMRSSFMLPFNPLFPRPVTFTFAKLVRFINYIKGMLDRGTGITRLSDLLDAKPAMRDGRDALIIARLLMEKGFFCYDGKEEGLRPEAVEPVLVDAFFRKAKGRTIRGFKTAHSLTVDV